MSSLRTIAHYKITAKLGEGGMGEVWRATDTKLNREVAIKILPEAFAKDADRMARFEREAQVLASLNHPNIAAIYGVEERAFIMEFVEGPTLADRIRQRAVAVEEALGIARQIAQALDAAHESGIVHRDLKPANIKLKPDGAVKVLDFGLAKVVAAPGVGEADDATATMSVTRAGSIVGTPSYMAPEQAQGQAIDKRVDIWAFGVVLYEMLTAERPFPADTITGILAAVLMREPAWDRVPPGLLPLLKRCLEKDPKQRLRDIGDARHLLESAEIVTPARTGARAVWTLGLCAGVLAITLATVLLDRGSVPEERAPVRLRVDLGREALSSAILEARISPDGRRIVYAARSPGGTPMLAVKPVGGSATTLLTGTENATAPFFSPDGQWIGFAAGGKLRKISAQGGAVVGVADTNAVMGASWGDDQSIVFSAGTATSLIRIPANDGTPAPITKVGEKGDATHRWPQVLPGARAVLFTSHKIVTGFDDATIEAVIIATGERKTVLRGGYYGRYVRDGNRSGYLLFIRDGVLFGAPFDVGKLTVLGTPTAIAENVAGDSDSGSGQFDAANDGTLIYRSGKGPSRNWPILWLDSSGKTEPLVPEPGAYHTIRLSPNGKRLAMSVDRGDRGREIEVFECERGSLSRLTFTREVNLFPLWSPDGKYLVFESSAPQGYGIGLVRADGSGRLQRLAEHAGLMIPTSFSPDGRWLAYYEFTPVGFVAWVAPFDVSDAEHPKLGAPRKLIDSNFSVSNPMYSPDGRWVTYASIESGQMEIYVTSSSGSGAKSKVSTGGAGGGAAVWAPDSRAIYFKARDNRLMISECRAEGNALLPGKPRVWADAPIGRSPFSREFTLAADGKRFAVVPPHEAPVEEGNVHVMFALNFLEDLRRKAR